jgi:hypothetical protein
MIVHKSRKVVRLLLILKSVNWLKPKPFRMKKITLLSAAAVLAAILPLCTSGQ